MCIYVMRNECLAEWGKKSGIDKNKMQGLVGAGSKCGPLSQNFAEKI
jgi:hypothetical protein